MALTNVRDIITKSFKLLGIGAEGETLTSEMMNDGIDSLNMLIGLWGSRNLMTTAEIGENFALTAAQASYLMGVSSVALPTDFDTVKPNKIISAFVRDSSGNDYPLKIITRQEYNDFEIKTTTGIPRYLFQDPGAVQQVNHVMTLYLYPAPESTTTYTLYLFSEKPMTKVSTLDDEITMPEVYITALVFNLPFFITPEYERPIPAEVVSIANQSLKAIETLNASQKKERVRIDPLNIITGDILNGG